jgi:hypothetical protein
MFILFSDSLSPPHTGTGTVLAGLETLAKIGSTRIAVHRGARWSIMLTGYTDCAGRDDHVHPKFQKNSNAAYSSTPQTRLKFKSTKKYPTVPSLVSWWGVALLKESAVT